MRIDVTQPLTDYRGKYITDGKDKEGKDRIAELRTIISNAVNIALPNKPVTAEAKNKAYQISIKVWSKKEVDLTVDEMAFIKERMGASPHFNPLIYGRVCDIFEGKAPVPPVEESQDKLDMPEGAQGKENESTT